MLKILVAEDEPHLRAAIAKTLTGEGYYVVECYDGQHALDTFEAEHIDCIVTDIMMPRMDGNRFASEVRKTNREIPILMLTALETIDDKERGFISGTDDYLVKPILMKELCLRVKALLRRYKINFENKIEHKNTVLDAAVQTLHIGGAPVVLAKKEFQLLFKLLTHPGVIFARERILNEIWGYDSASTDRTVDTHISWLREKTMRGDFEIQTVYGLGYKAVLK